MMSSAISLTSLGKCNIAHHGIATSLAAPKRLQTSILHQNRTRKFLLRCSKPYPWQASPLYVTEENDAKPNDIMETMLSERTKEFPILEREADAVETETQSSVLVQSLKWPMWLLGPSVVLVTGMTPTLWLPLSSVFLGPNTAGIFSLLGLDCIFNMGATLFLLMADACARPNYSTPHNGTNSSQIPLMYKFWNLFASVLGFVIPVVLLFCSNKGLLEPQLPFIPFSVLMGPYLLLLSVQMLTEILTWHWKSPVWLVAPVIYEGYRILQLMRGLRLGTEIGAPGWAVASIRGLVSWWILVIAVQLMRVAWFAGYASKTQENREAL